VVAPGFIDMHSHSDLFYFACPSAESKVRQGVATEGVGVGSFSQGPLRAPPPAVNIAHFVGHGALRIAAMGFEARPAGADDLRGMERLLGEALDAGAVGFSTGPVYPPAPHSDTTDTH